MSVKSAFMIKFIANVQKHATPLVGASVETGVGVHATGDVVDSAASGGCSVSPCSESSFLGSLQYLVDLYTVLELQVEKSLVNLV